MAIRGGHLISCVIGATGEIILDALPASITRGPSDDLRLGPLRF
jgi:predicted DNA-binding protein with PD1-like motif